MIRLIRSYNPSEAAKREVKELKTPKDIHSIRRSFPKKTLSVSGSDPCLSCYFCGGAHSQSECRFRKSECHFCHKQSHNYCVSLSSKAKQAHKTSSSGKKLMHKVMEEEAQLSCISQQTSLRGTLDPRCFSTYGGRYWCTLTIISRHT